MRHLCGSCRETSIDNDAVASIENRLSHGDVVHALRKPHILELEYVRRSIEGTLDKKPAHLRALILRSLKDSSNIGTSKRILDCQRDLIPSDLSIRGDEISLIPRATSTLGDTVSVSIGSG